MKPADVQDLISGGFHELKNWWDEREPWVRFTQCMRNRVPLAPNQTTKTTVKSTAAEYKNDSEINKIQHVIHSVQPQIDEQ